MDKGSSEQDLKEIEHHKQFELCKTRPAYRQGRNLTAVKVYTVCNESPHLFVYGVSKINLRNELKSLFSKHGKILKLHVVPNLKTEMFTECYHIQYERIQSARIAKRFLDNRSFYGNILHVCYAPEEETLAETEEKLVLRKNEVNRKLDSNEYSTLYRTKRKYSEITESEPNTSPQINDFIGPQLELNREVKTDSTPEMRDQEHQPYSRPQPAQKKRIVFRKKPI